MVGVVMTIQPYAIINPRPTVHEHAELTNYVKDTLGRHYAVEVKHAFNLCLPDGEYVQLTLHQIPIRRQYYTRETISGLTNLERFLWYMKDLEDLCKTIKEKTMEGLTIEVTLTQELIDSLWLTYQREGAIYGNGQFGFFRWLKEGVRDRGLYSVFALNIGEDAAYAVEITKYKGEEVFNAKG